MEEDEDTNPSKKPRRKRKPRRDLTPPELDTPIDSEEELNDGEEKKRKRGRRKKKKEPSPPPEPKEEPTDMQRMFQIVEQLMTSVGVDAFLDRPDDSIQGLSDYYEIITRPMWLKEIKRKYNEDKYSTPTEIAADVRLMLENCYQYWGPCDTLSKRALKLEQTFENKIVNLPEEVQKQCTLEATHGDLVKEEPDDSVTRKPNNKKGGFVSRLLDWVLYGRGRDNEEEAKNSARSLRAAREGAEKELAAWEVEHLLTSGAREQIASMWEFPVIGQFLHLVYNVLNIEPISHLELERMLLMPQASKTLATLITSMLIPPLFRAKLEANPAMPYAVWTNRLTTKVTSWYRAYRTKGDSTVEVFDSLGIEPQFWLVMGEDNLLEEYQFHELSFLQRVWLLKALCDFLLHNHKTIQDCINNLDMDELREINLGRDKEGYSYHYFPMFSEVRIYKMAKVLDAKWKNYEAGVEEAIAMCAEEEDDEEQAQEQNLIGFGRKPLHKPPRSMRPSHSGFRLVCESVEDVRKLLDELSSETEPSTSATKPPAKLLGRLRDVLRGLESREAKLDLAAFSVRKRMRDEWNQFRNRAEDYIDPGLAYWERKEKEEKKASEEKPPDLSIPSTSSEHLFGDDEKRERRTRRESSLKIMSKEGNKMYSDESEEESPLDFDDNSEDEWFATKRDKENKKKKRCMSARRHKKLAINEKFQHSRSGNDDDGDKLNLNSSSGSVFQSSINEKAGGSKETLVKVKQELPDPDDLANNISSNKHHGALSKPLGKENPKSESQESLKSKKNTPIVKQEIIEESHSTATTNANNQSVIQSLVPDLTNVKMEKKPRTPVITPMDISKLKRSNSPENDVVYISDSEDSPDIKPNPALLAQRLNANKVAPTTINYSMSLAQEPLGNVLVPGTGQNPPSQFVLPPGDQVFNTQPQLFTQQPSQPVTYQVQPPAIVPQSIIRPNPTIMAATRATVPPNQKFVVIQQPNTANVNQANQFINKNPQAQNNNFPTTPTMQSVNWFGPRGSSPSNYSPRQRSAGLVVVRGQSPRGRGARSPMTPTRGVQRFAGRTPPNNVRTPTSVIRTPTQLGVRTASPIRGRGVTTPIRPNQGPVRNLNFNRSPVKPISKPVPTSQPPPRSNSPDIEGTLVVSMTESGGFGYVVMLPDGGKISLTQDQLAKIRSDNGGTLPKTCKVPLNMNTEGFRID